VVKINKNGNDLDFRYSTFGYDQERASVVEKYGLELLKKSKHEKGFRKYIANIGEEEFIELMNDDNAITYFKLLKIEPAKLKWIKWLGLILSLGVVVLMINYKKKKKLEY